MGQPFLFENAPRSTRQAARSAHQIAVDGWHRLWRETRGEDWAWAPLDFRRIRDTLKFRSGGDPEPLLQRAQRLLTRPPNAWMAQNASPGVLYSHWNALGAVEVRRLTRDEQNLAALRAAMEVL